MNMKSVTHVLGVFLATALSNLIAWIDLVRAEMSTVLYLIKETMSIVSISIAIAYAIWRWRRDKKEAKKKDFV